MNNEITETAKAYIPVIQKLNARAAFATYPDTEITLTATEVNAIIVMFSYLEAQYSSITELLNSLAAGEKR